MLYGRQDPLYNDFVRRTVVPGGMGVGEKFEELRKNRLKLTVRGMAEAMGWKYGSNYQYWASGNGAERSHVTPDVAERAMRLLDKGSPPITKDDILELFPPVTEDDEDLHPVAAPLISWVSAGQLVSVDHVQEEDSARKVYAPDLDPKGDWIALKVEGDSMDRISPPESIIFVNRKDRTLAPNACYVIADDEGNATYKRWRPDPDRWEPVSVNTEHETTFIEPGKRITVIGRVRKSVLNM